MPKLSDYSQDSLPQDIMRQRLLGYLVDLPDLDVEDIYNKLWYAKFNAISEFRVNDQGIVYGLDYLKPASDEYESDKVKQIQVDTNETPESENIVILSYVTRNWGSIENWRLANQFEDYRFSRFEKISINKLESKSRLQNSETITLLDYLSTFQYDPESRRKSLEWLDKNGLESYHSEPVAQSFEYRNFKIATFKNGSQRISGITPEQMRRYFDLVNLVATKPGIFSM